MSLLAGAATVDISPPLGVQLFGYPHVHRLATGIHDPLLASALVLRQGDTTQACLALDLLFLDPPTARAARRRVASTLGIEERRVFVSCTHTHSGPVTTRLLGWDGDVGAPPPDPAYLESVVVRVVEAAQAAAARLAPAEAAWTRAPVEGVGGNRHDPAGPADPEAGVLMVRAAEDGRALAAITVYSMHPTVLHEDSTLVSADFPYYTRLALRERLGPGLVTLYFNGPSGNQSPRHHVKGQTFGEAERLGRRLGAAIADAVANLSPGTFSRAVTLNAAVRPFVPVRRQVPSPADAVRQLAAYRSEYGRLVAAGAPRAAVRTAECSVFGAEGAVVLARLQASGEIARLLAEYEPFEVQAVRVGEAALVGFPGELFTEYGLAVKRLARGRVFPVAFTNGELQGYIVTPEAAAAGGYEAVGAVFASESWPLMLAAARELLVELGFGGCA